MNKILKRIKSMLINKLHRVCYESKDSPTADSFADDMKNFTEAFGHLDIHDNLLAELKNRLKISIFLWRKSCASR